MRLDKFLADMGLGSRKEVKGLIKKGTIEVGKYADLVVLSDDIFQIDAQKIQDVAVLKTMVNGEFVFSKE